MPSLQRERQALSAKCFRHVHPEPTRLRKLGKAFGKAGRKFDPSIGELRANLVTDRIERGKHALSEGGSRLKNHPRALIVAVRPQGLKLSPARCESEQ